MNKIHKKRYKIQSMHCASCEVLIEDAIKKIPGVERVEVSQPGGYAYIKSLGALTVTQLQEALALTGGEYIISDPDSPTPEHNGPKPLSKNTREDYIHIGAAFLIIAAVYLILKQFDITPDLGITENMSYGFVFMIGIVAALSTCLAVTGGLLLAVAAKHNAENPHLTGMQKFKPHLYFNVGRIISYTGFGAAVGAAGSLFTLSPKANGILTIAASLVMILLGFQLLNLFPQLQRFQPRMPKFIAHKIQALKNSQKGGAFTLGASTFFLPCGFTQALQLYVLSEGSATKGALTMLAFSLGTLPALMSLGAFSSFAKGSIQKHFIKFAGVLVILVGMFSVNNGLTLTGTNISLAAVLPGQEETKSGEKEDLPRIENGKQIIEMTVEGLRYSPNRFTVYQGIPVEWRIEGQGAKGCGQVLIMPKANLVQYLNPQKTTIATFTPQETGDFSFNCAMGMMTPNSGFTVIPNRLSPGESLAPLSPSSAPIQETEWSECDPAIANCLEAKNGEVQKFSMEVSAERGFYPNEFVAKKGIPIELEMDTSVDLGGCMSTIVVPEYGIAQLIPQGKSTVKFTPTEAGIVTLSCPMGIEMGRFIIE